MPKIIKPTDPVLPIKPIALSGFPAIYKPHPTTAKIPPGINGHQTNFLVNVLEVTVINPQPKANPTSIIPICSKGLFAFVFSQAKYKPGANPTSNAPGIIKPNNLQYLPAIKKQNPILTPI